MGKSQNSGEDFLKWQNEVFCKVQATNRSHKYLWETCFTFWLCVPLHLVNRAQCLLFSNANFLLLPPDRDQRIQLRSLWSCAFVFHHSIATRSYLTTEPGWAHHPPSGSYEWNSLGQSHSEEGAMDKVLVFDYVDVRLKEVNSKVIVIRLLHKQ